MTRKPVSSASVSSCSRASKRYRPRSGSAAAQSTHVLTLLNPSDLIATRYRRHASRSAAGFRDTIGARVVPPPYHTPIGTKGADDCGGGDGGMARIATTAAPSATRIASYYRCFGASKFCRELRTNLRSRLRGTKRELWLASRAKVALRSRVAAKEVRIPHHGPRAYSRFHRAPAASTAPAAMNGNA